VISKHEPVLTEIFTKLKLIEVWCYFEYYQETLLERADVDTQRACLIDVWTKDIGFWSPTKFNDTFASKLSCSSVVFEGTLTSDLVLKIKEGYLECNVVC
jgi:hypothetical protein